MNVICATKQKSYSSYFLWVLLLLPIDWFEPTGLLFREFGAKPATLLLTFGGIYGLLLLRPLSKSGARSEIYALLIFLTLLLFNSFAFLVNSIYGWSDVPSLRSPLLAFFNQTMLIIAAGVALIGNLRIFTHINQEIVLTRLIPKVSAIHLFIWVLEAAFPSLAESMLALFRGGGFFIERASGLMSEPSYYGAMAALFAIPMLMAPQFKGRTGVRLLAVGLIASAVFVSAKTMVVVAFMPILFLLFALKQNILRNFLAVFFTCIITLHFIQSNQALNLEENLSSVMRIGSAHLGFNVAMSEKGVSGIGAGQFHFQYREEYAPQYLLFSNEALSQMMSDSETRASTYNFYLRVWIELGIMSFALLSYAFLSLFRVTNEGSLLQKMFLLSSLGFLLTQDTYFYPPLIFSCALLAALPKTSAIKKISCATLNS